MRRVETFRRRPAAERAGVVSENILRHLVDVSRRARRLRQPRGNQPLAFLEKIRRATQRPAAPHVVNRQVRLLRGFGGRNVIFARPVHILVLPAVQQAGGVIVVLLRDEAQRVGGLDRIRTLALPAGVLWLRIALSVQNEPTIPCAAAWALYSRASPTYPPAAVK